MKILIFFFLFMSSIAYAQVLSLDTVKESTVKHYPQILIALQAVVTAKSEYQEKLGAFDTIIDGDFGRKDDSLKDRDNSKLVISKRLQALNSKIYAGFRNSSGKFAVYEENDLTANSGASLIGAQFSLLRNRSIDKYRLELMNARLGVDQSEFALKRLQQIILNIMTKTYNDWYLKGKKVVIYETLLNVATQRNDAIEKRIKKGDLAPIYLEENKQYILKWRRKLLESKNNFLQASLKLSLFYRDNQGKVIIPGFNNLPADLNIIDIKSVKNADQLQEVFKNSPELEKLRLYVKQLENNRAYADSQLLPELNLKLENERQLERIESDVLPQEETKISLNLNIPIERNLAKGKVAQYQAKITQAKLKIRYLKNKIKVKINSLFSELSTNHLLIENSEKETLLAKKLEQAEKSRFESGDSDFFVINIREQNSVEAQISLFEANVNYLNALADYQLALIGVL